MEPFKLRLITEYKELQIKLNSLIAFISSDKSNDIPSEDLILLSVQKHTMQTYLYILALRMKLLEMEIPEDEL